MSRNIDIVDEVTNEANFIASVAELVEELLSPDTKSVNTAPEVSISRVMRRVIDSAEHVGELIQELHELNRKSSDASKGVTE